MHSSVAPKLMNKLKPKRTQSTRNLSGVLQLPFITLTQAVPFFPEIKRQPIL